MPHFGKAWGHTWHPLALLANFRQACGMLNDAIKDEILQSHALAYRRNTIGFALALCVIHWLPGANFSDLSLFGVKPPVGTGAKLVICALWLMLIYNALAFAYYVWWDWRIWVGKALEPLQQQIGVCAFFPELRMYFRKPPSKSKNQAEVTGATWANWELKEGSDWVVWQPANEAHAKLRYVVSSRHTKLFRERIYRFGLFEFGVPAALVICASASASALYFGIPPSSPMPSPDCGPPVQMAPRKSA